MICIQVFVNDLTTKIRYNFNNPNGHGHLSESENSRLIPMYRQTQYIHINGISLVIS